MISRYFYRQVTSEMNTYFFMTSRNKAARGLRAIPFLLGLLMLLPVAAHAQREMYGRLNAADSTLTLYYDANRQDGDYPANAEGSGYGSPEWLNDQVRATTKTVVFDPGFKDARPTSCNSWFSLFENLEHIQGIEHLNTSEVRFMGYMFYSCKKLAEIDVSHFQTDCVTEMNSMFSECIALTSLDLSNFDTGKVTDMNHMFCRCESLASLDLGHFNVEKVRSMGRMFAFCNKLTEIDLSGCNASAVTTMAYMFNSCKALTSIKLPISTAGNLTSMEEMFQSCQNLKHIQGLENLNTSNVTNMRAVFAYCEKLNDINLSSFDTRKVTSMNSMFSGCEALTSLDLSSFDTSNVTDMGWMFYCCSGLTSLNLDSFITERTTTMQSMFYYCNGLTGLDLSNFDTRNVTNMSYMFCGCTSLDSLDLSSFNVEKVESMASMFAQCAITSIDLSHFNTKSLKSMLSMFYGCNGLTGLDLSNFDTRNVTNMSYMFCGCKSLDSLDLSSFNVEKVEDMAFMFAQCNMTSIDLSHFNTKSLKSMQHMFKGCTRLERFNLSGFDTEKVGILQGMFEGCKSLQVANLSNFNTASLTDVDLMFYGCTSLASVDLSSFVTDKLTSMRQMFANCVNLKTIYASSAFTTANLNSPWGETEIFKGCTSLPNYDSNKTGKELARIGEGGYFTVAPAWVRFDEGTGTLTFHCSTAKTDAATDYSLNEGRDTPGWNAKAGDIKTVTFTRSFRDVRPTDCSMWFYKCENLTRIDGMENLNTSEATDMQYMFNGCKKLDSLDLSGFSTANITSMQAMFKGCSGLTALNLSGFSTGNVTSMQEMFANCSSLTALDLSSFSGSRVTTTELMFSGCASLAAVSLAQFDTPKLKYMDKMFQNCSALTKLDLSSFDLKEMNFQNGVSGGQLFDYCQSLQTIYVGDSFELKEGNKMFRGCDNLRGAIAFDSGKTGVDMASYVSGYLTKKVGTNGGDIIGATGDQLVVEALQLDDSKAFILYEPCRVKDAAYTRPMKAEWGTLCLPYAIGTEFDGDNCLFYALSEVGENSVTLEELKTRRVTAGYPVIVRKKDAGREEISVKHAAGEVGEQLVTAPIGETAGNRLVGTFATAQLADDCYFLANDKFRLVGDYKEVASGVKLAAFRAYIQPQQQTAAQRAPVLSINMDGETSAIDTPAVVGALNDAATEYYDMNGRRTDGLRKGMNIVKAGDRVMKVLVK